MQLKGKEGFDFMCNKSDLCSIVVNLVVLANNENKDVGSALISVCC